MTHAGDLSQVFAYVYLQDLDSNLLPLVFTLLHIPKPAAIYGDSGQAISELDFQQSWK